jgi:hypothetical protein
MQITKRNINRNVNRMLKVLLGAMPAIPYVMRSRRRTPIGAYVLGGLGIAVAGGLTALMFFSPRTRSRALHAAKDTYEKVNDKIIHHRIKGSDVAPMSNGLVEREEHSSTGI